MVFLLVLIYFCILFTTAGVNPFHTEFPKWINKSSIFGTVHYRFQGYQDEESTNSIDPCQTARICRLTLLNTDGKG